ncbi:hypothetical protein CMI43_03235 [Candidatus Pacearchaeota archaeon]|nr:hypothetical protein [Candidatus Pacearchaeota archaeon]|tara:strand:- start:2244 stop:2897 length:654 start_codon:yes stop_codon:yes gene_type:complete
MPELLEKYNINKQQGLMFALLVGYFFYISSTTSLVPNYNDETDSVMYDITSLAPKGYVTNNQLLLGIGLIILFAMSFKIKELQKNRVSERQFKEYLSKVIKDKQEIKFSNGKYEFPSGDFKIDKDIRLVEEIIENKRNPKKYVAQVIITDRNKFEHYYHITGNPITMMIDDIIETDQKLELMDKCPDCGRYPDEKIILAEDLRRYKDIKKSLSIDHE